MRTVTVQDPSAVVSARAGPTAPATLGAPEVSDEFSSFGEFECEWALDREDE